MSYYLLTNKRLFINLFIYRSVFHFPIDRQISAFGRLECPPVNFNTYYYKFKYVTHTVLSGNTFRNYDGKSIFIEVLHIYIYDPVTIVRVSTPLHCCNIIKRVIPPFAIALSL